jgi:hypothetical protein
MAKHAVPGLLLTKYKQMKTNKQVCYMAKNAVQGPLEDATLPWLTLV